MKLSFILAVGFLFFTGCATTKHHRQVASVHTKTIAEFADYTMANIYTPNRMPASASGHVDFTESYDDQVVVMADLYDSMGSSNKKAEMTFKVRNHPEISGKLSGNSATSANNKLFVAIVSDMIEHGIRPTANQALTGMKLQVGAIQSLQADQKEEALKHLLLEFRDQLFEIYKDLPVK
jgi:PBP1b-binding outer membrane lipoprotein LpoB